MAKYALFGLYIILILMAGIVSRKNTQSSEGYFLGGRNVGPVLSAFAFVTTYISAVALVNAGTFGWKYGIGAMFNAFGNVILGIFLAWLLLGKKTREMSQRLQTSTMPDFLRVRYQSHFFKIVGGLIIFIFMVPYSGSVFMGLSYIFESVFNIPYIVALAIMTALTGMYLILGGYKAVALVDAIQGIIMVIGSIFIVFFLVKSPYVGGFVKGLNRLNALDPDLVSVSLGGWEKWKGLLSVILLTSLGPLGMPQLSQKFFAIDDPRSIRAATIVCTICGIIIICGIHFIGVYVHLFFNELPIDPITGKPNVELLAPKMLEMFLPEILLAFTLLFVVSASMSTLSGLVLVSSSSIAMDLIKGYLKKDMKDKTVTLIMRSLSALFVASSFVIAVTMPESILNLISLSWGAIAGFFIGPYVYGVLWKGVTKTGAIIGGITGFLLAILLPTIFHVDKAVACAFALTIPLLIVPLVSVLTKKLPYELVCKAFGETD